MKSFSNLTKLLGGLYSGQLSNGTKVYGQELSMTIGNTYEEKPMKNPIIFGFFNVLNAEWHYFTGMDFTICFASRQDDDGTLVKEGGFIIYQKKMYAVTAISPLSKELNACVAMVEEVDKDSIGPQKIALVKDYPYFKTICDVIKFYTRKGRFCFWKGKDYGHKSLFCRGEKLLGTFQVRFSKNTVTDPMVIGYKFANKPRGEQHYFEPDDSIEITDNTLTLNGKTYSLTKKVDQILGHLGKFVIIVKPLKQ